MSIAQTVADWLSRLLRDYSGTKDIGGLERSLFARRLLRKQFPKRARELATQHRYPDHEWAHVRKSRDRFNWALKQDVTLEDGVKVFSGMAVITNWTGFSVEVFAFWSLSQKSTSGRLAAFLIISLNLS